MVLDNYRIKPSMIKAEFSYVISFRQPLVASGKALPEIRHKKSPQNSSAGTLLFTLTKSGFVYTGVFDKKELDTANTGNVPFEVPVS